MSGDISQLSKGGWGLGRVQGAGTLLPHHIQFCKKPSFRPEVPNTHGGCVYSEHRRRWRQAAVGGTYTPPRQALRSSRQTPTMRGGSRFTQNQDRAGKTRRFRGFTRLRARRRLRRASPAGCQAEPGGSRRKQASVMWGRRVGAATETFTPHNNNRRRSLFCFAVGASLVLTAAAAL